MCRWNYLLSSAKLVAISYQNRYSNEMLNELKALSNDQIDAWIHSAAVLDYVVDSPAEGKLASQESFTNNIS